MSNNPTAPDARAAAPRGLAALLPYRQHVGIGLLVLGGLLAIIPIVSWVRYGSYDLDTLVWGAVLSLTCLAGGVACRLGPEGDAKAQEDHLRIVLLTVGSVCGLATVVLGLVLPLTQYRGVFFEGPKAWRQNAWRMTACGVALIGGLAVIFASVQLARVAERTSAAMRRLVYGYNAALSGILLVIILGLVNVLGYFFVKTTSDWTASGIYTLSTGTRNFLTGLKKPVTLYLLLPRSWVLTQEMQTLAENARSVNDKVNWELLSPDLNRDEVQKLRDKFLIKERAGVLVTYGTEPGLSWEFIKPSDLVEEVPDRRSRQSARKFKGESVLMKSLVYLSENKSRAVVYFTQGAGELELKPGQGRRDGRDLGTLRQRLGDANYEVKELRLGQEATAVPKDADVVVVARPTHPFTPEAVKALRDYMGRPGDKKGTLIVLLDVVARPDGGMVPTGLEALLGEYNVKVGNDRVVVVQGRFRNPTWLDVVCNPQANNPIPAAFLRPDRIEMFLFQNARTVTAVPADPRRRSPYAAEDLLLVFPYERPIIETDLSVNPVSLAAQWRNPNTRGQVIGKLARRPVSVAVAVAESDSNLPRIPGHAQFLKEKPRLVVFGDADWITSESVEQTSGQLNVDLFTSCLSWLRGRSDLGEKAEGKVNRPYRLGVVEPTITYMEWLPLGLMALAVVGMGCGVWVVRRR